MELFETKIHSSDRMSDFEMRVGRKEASRKLTKEVKEKLKILKISER
jgi:hypothetical protein